MRARSGFGTTLDLCLPRRQRLSMAAMLTNLVRSKSVKLCLTPIMISNMLAALNIATSFKYQDGQQYFIQEFVLAPYKMNTSSKLTIIRNWRGLAKRKRPRWITNYSSNMRPQRSSLNASPRITPWTYASPSNRHLVDTGRRAYATLPPFRIAILSPTSAKRGARPT
jgi:hypothetical protein